MAENDIYIGGALGRPVPDRVVVVGAGLGGVQALSKFLPDFPSDFAGTIVVIQDTRPGFTRVLANKLASICSLPVEEVMDGMALDRPRILVANSGESVSFVGHCSLESGSCGVTVNGIAPKGGRVNSTMISAAAVFRELVVGIVFTGLGTDGVQGIEAISESGGLTLAQDEPTCTAYDTPRAAVNAGVGCESVPLWDLAHRVIWARAGGEYAATA